MRAADLIVAHNAEFDLGFINRELAACNEPLISRHPCFLHHGRMAGAIAWTASRDAAASRIGLTRAGSKHNAIEDAWLALMIYLHLHGSGPIRSFSALGLPSEPRNLRRSAVLNASKAPASSERGAPEFGPMLPPADDAEPLVREFPNTIAGVDDDNHDGSSRQEIIFREVTPGMQLVLRPELNNRVDPGRIAVLTPGGEQLGYLQR